MKAVILAAGKGTRMKPLTADTPKPLLPVAGKSIIQHNIEIVEDKVDEIIIVAGYEIEQFRDKYSDIQNIRIIEQEKALGTADAALQAINHIGEKALILNGDDIYGKNLLEMMEKNSAVLGSEVDDPTKYGVFETEYGEIKDIVEKPENPTSNLANTGAYLLKESFFDLLKNVERSERGEYEITDALLDYVNQEEVEVIEAERWIPCSYPWQLITANKTLISSIEHEIKGQVSELAELKGNIVIEEGAEIREFTVVEGPAIIKSGSEVGPNAYIRPGTVLEENVKVGSSEVKNSVVRANTNLPHFNYVGDSYIGKDVNFGAGTKVANLRNDDGNLDMHIKGKKLDTGKKKLGAIVGSEAKIGVNNSIKPGRKIGFGAISDSNEKIETNLPDKCVFKDGEVDENRN